MKTMDQIVKCLVACSTKHCEAATCPYGQSNSCYNDVMLDASEAIIHLLRDNQELAESLRKAELKLRIREDL